MLKLIVGAAIGAAAVAITARKRAQMLNRNGGLQYARGRGEDAIDQWLFAYPPERRTGLIEPSRPGATEERRERQPAGVN